MAVSFVPDKTLVSDREEIFKVIEFFKDIGINDMRLTSPILSGKLTRKPEERLSPENVETSSHFCLPGPECYAEWKYTDFKVAPENIDSIIADMMKRFI